MKEKENWECFLCCQEADFAILPSAYLSNSHPLCVNCADEVLKNVNHKHRFRLTYHQAIGDLILVSGLLIPTGNFTKD